MTGWLKRIADYRNPTSLSARLRQQRMGLFWGFVRDLRGPDAVSILDVGGSATYWRTVRAPERVRVTVLNLSPKPSGAETPWIQADIRDISSVPDDSFDVVFSNSTIEHVGSWADQKQAASEIMRVGRAYFVQTPNFWFPVEPHFLVPGFQFLPARLRAALHARRDLGWMSQAPSREQARSNVEEIRLLRRPEMRRLFPGCTLHVERFLGLPKSFVAYGRAPGRAE